MQLFPIFVLFSSLSFLIYGIAYFTSDKMKHEFIRFGLSRFGTITAVLEILGGLGLLVGLIFNFFLILSAGGLATMMLLGVGARLRVGDGLLAILPAVFYMILNAYIFLEAISPVG
jgi:uncharacterized membrane protein